MFEERKHFQDCVSKIYNRFVDRFKSLLEIILICYEIVNMVNI